ncbi:MAG: hypothetical protein PWP46_1348, partial [Fusobacteriaceae bacterium]|nr:hypothetical protein [Fusobacteriaceae bacterium]
MKKLILIYFIIFSYTFSAYEIFDNSYILKIGTHLGGNYYETITDNLGTSHKDNTTITPFTSRTYSFELHN